MNHILILIAFAAGASMLALAKQKSKNNTSIIAPAFFLFLATYTWLGVSIGIPMDMPFDFINTSTQESIERSIIYFMICAASMSIGVTIFYTLHRPQNKYSENKKSALINKSNKLKAINQKTLIASSVAWPILFIFSYGATDLLQREIYRPEFNWETGLKISSLILPLSSVATGLIKNRALRYLISALIFTISLGASSRISAIFFIFYGAGSLIRTQKISKTKIFTLVALTLWISSFAIQARNLPIQGIIHNSIHLMNGVSIKEMLYNINYLTSFSIGVLAYSIDSYYTLKNLGVLSAALNPAPSFLISQQNYSLSLIGSAPYSSFGILYNESYWIGPIYFLLCGVSFSACMEFIGKKNTYIWLLFVLLYALFAFYSTQYYLRDSSRFLYYPIYICIIYAVYEKTKATLRRI